MAVFTGAQLVSGLVAPTLLDHVPRRPRAPRRRQRCSAASGEVGVWLAPEAAPWVWALLLGAGQGACFALGLALLVRYAATPRDSARLTAMAFLVSYTVASFGPATMGAVEDVTGSFAALWALLALVSVPQLVVRPAAPTGPAPGGRRGGYGLTAGTGGREQPHRGPAGCCADRFAITTSTAT